MPLLFLNNSRWFQGPDCLYKSERFWPKVNNLNADFTIMAFRRFSARRGCPRIIHSDNGPYFACACVELLSLIQKIDDKKINEYAVSRAARTEVFHEVR